MANDNSYQTIQRPTDEGGTETVLAFTQTDRDAIRRVIRLIDAARTPLREMNGDDIDLRHTERELFRMIADDGVVLRVEEHGAEHMELVARPSGLIPDPITERER